MIHRIMADSHSWMILSGLFQFVVPLSVNSFSMHWKVY